MENFQKYLAKFSVSIEDYLAIPYCIKQKSNQSNFWFETWKNNLKNGRWAFIFMTYLFNFAWLSSQYLPLKIIGF
jgi:hypothetical protein